MILSSDYPVTLPEIAKAVNGTIFFESNGNISEPVIHSITATSDLARTDSLFVAITGTKVDGHNFIEKARVSGAQAAIVQDPARLAGMPGIVVSDTRLALSQLAELFSGRAARQLSPFVGVTGTNGKTTTTWLIASLFEGVFGSTLALGTLGARLGGIEFEPSPLTTPDPLLLHSVIRRAIAAGTKSCVMEVSSIGVVQKRVANLPFTAGVFTNLTQDHLDLHGDMETYYRCKEQFFIENEGSHGRHQTAIVNIDCPYGRRLARRLESEGLELATFGCADDSTIRIMECRESVNGSEFTLKVGDVLQPVQTGLIGHYNVANITAAIAVGLIHGIDLKLLVEKVGLIPTVPGRLERIDQAGITVFVDYAHTPDALINVLKALKPITSGKLWVIVGCGGDRDRGKRPLMGNAATQLADRVVITSDNPRTEDPERIIQDILSDGCQPYLTEVDRRQAIQRVLREAEPEDVVLIAGKGHEDYQIIGERKIHFSDAEEVRSFFAKESE